MSITPSPPGQAKGVRFEHGSVLGGKIRAARVSSRWKSTALHSEHFPASFWPRAARPGVLVVESRLAKSTIDNLVERGHKVELGSDWSEGRLTAASRIGRRKRAAANPRGMQGYAIGR
jgi:Gamma-glutamyltranspeptidase